MHLKVQQRAEHDDVIDWVIVDGSDQAAYQAWMLFPVDC